MLGPSHPCHRHHLAGVEDGLTFLGRPVATCLSILYPDPTILPAAMPLTRVSKKHSREKESVCPPGGEAQCRGCPEQLPGSTGCWGKGADRVVQGPREVHSPVYSPRIIRDMITVKMGAELFTVSANETATFFRLTSPKTTVANLRIRGVLLGCLVCLRLGPRCQPGWGHTGPPSCPSPLSPPSMPFWGCLGPGPPPTHKDF